MGDAWVEGQGDGLPEKVSITSNARPCEGVLSPMFKLVISDDEGKTTVVPLVRDEITIGRKEGNTIRLTERNVSRRHARIHRKSADYVLEDLASYNGIVVNGARRGELYSKYTYYHSYYTPKEDGQAPDSDSAPEPVSQAADNSD